MKNVKKIAVEDHYVFNVQIDKPKVQKMLCIDCREKTFNEFQAVLFFCGFFHRFFGICTDTLILTDFGQILVDDRLEIGDIHEVLGIAKDFYFPQIEIKVLCSNTFLRFRVMRLKFIKQNSRNCFRGVRKLRPRKLRPIGNYAQSEITPNLKLRPIGNYAQT